VPRPWEPADDEPDEPVRADVAARDERDHDEQPGDRDQRVGADASDTVRDRHEQRERCQEQRQASLAGGHPR
jgi:hypothetical protein